MGRNVSRTVKTGIAVIVAAVAVGLFGATAAHADDTSGGTPAPTPTATSSINQPWG